MCAVQAASVSVVCGWAAGPDSQNRAAVPDVHSVLSTGIDEGAAWNSDRPQAVLCESRREVALAFVIAIFT